MVQDDDNNDDANMNEDQENPPVMYLDPTSAHGEIAGVPPPENSVELLGVAPQ